MSLTGMLCKLTMNIFVGASQESLWNLIAKILIVNDCSLAPFTRTIGSCSLLSALAIFWLINSAVNHGILTISIISMLTHHASMHNLHYLLTYAAQTQKATSDQESTKGLLEDNVSTLPFSGLYYWTAWSEFCTMSKKVCQSEIEWSSP